MKFNELNVQSHKTQRRVGRGISAGQGKTAGRGTKGQKARTGSSKRPGFEGGQNPLMQRLPKLRGFRSFKPKAENVYTGDLEKFGGKVIDATLLAENGLISSAFVNVKLLKRGDLSKKVSVKLPSASQTAIEAVEKAGGSFEKTARLGRTSTKTEGDKRGRAAKKSAK